MDATRAAIEGFGRVNAIIGRVGVVAGAGLIALMTVVVVVGVFFRYVLNNSISWVEDVSLIMMVSTAFLVAPFAYRTGANVAIEMLTAQLPQLALRVLRIAINVMVLWILYRHFFESLLLVERGWAIRVNTVPVAWAWPYMVVPVAFVGMALIGFELILRDLWALMARSPALDLPHHAPQEPE
ncbi:TRAP transporter small permease subunit [Aquibium sp. A9E412]|uniref:TRAP transporter small permease n=1 Tax=Aquibium sp. A9E412 TaxID=2976767 RepID=UPI0025B00C8F|nr:TRAP transporter small permease subunit [Aquibium sp. A9E412]MDN2566788.1 TRAP transporter small permease subunit [Aquibium sp. A9E412]